MISIDNLTKEFGGHTLFRELSFSMGPGERLGVVGRNGHGKTTLLRIISGQELPDSGEVVIPKGYRLGHLRQRIIFPEGSVLQAASEGLDEAEIWKVERALSGLGFQTSDFERPVGEFSGGWQMRIELTRVLVAEPNLLLLDEPTNYLDIGTIRWLESYLQDWAGEILFVSHNRSFVDSLSTHILGIHRQKAVRVKGDTGTFWTQVGLMEETMEKQRANMEKKRQQTMLFVDRFRAKAQRARQAQSKLKMLERMEVPEELMKIHDLSFRFNTAPVPPKYSLDVRDATFGYDKNLEPLFRHLSLSVHCDDRIGIIGRNGRGKTTLAKLIAGSLDPWEGSVRPHTQCRIACFDQSLTGKLSESNTVARELLDARGDGDMNAARKVAGSMQFSGDLALKTISVLSGGERSRVALGKIISTPANLLILDEPTHHLDLPSCEALIRAVKAFPGAVILVSHDEHLLSELTRRLVIFREDGPEVFEGSYTDFLEQDGWETDHTKPPTPTAASKAGAAGGSKPVMSKKDLRRERAAFNQRKRDALGGLEKTIVSVEADIAHLENRLELENAQLTLAAEKQDAKGMAVLAQTSGQLRKQVKTLYDRLDKLAKEHQEAEKVFLEEAKRFESDSV